MVAPKQPQIDPIKLSRWQGGVDQKLNGLDSRLGGVEIRLDNLPDKIEKRLAKVINDSPSGGRNAVTFRWVLEKIALPLIIGGGSAGAVLYAIVKSLQSGSLGLQ